MKVVDANVLIHGRGLNQDLVTVPEVMNEMKSRESKQGLASFKVETRTCSDESLERVKDKSGEINSQTSEADEKFLALALDLDEPLMTDDKGLQNLALHLGVKVDGFMDPVTDKKLSWKIVCSNCGKSECSCGANSVRKLDQCNPV